MQDLPGLREVSTKQTLHILKARPEIVSKRLGINPVDSRDGLELLELTHESLSAAFLPL